MSTYTSGEYVYFKNITDITDEHHNNFILNKILDMYITSLLKFLDKIFKSLPNLFVDKILKKWMNAHIQIMAQLSKVNVCNKDNQQMEPMYNSR